MTTVIGTVSSTAGSVNWTNLAQIYVSNNVYATTNSSISNSAVTGNIVCLGNGFSAPDGSTINGVALVVEAKQQASGNSGFSIRPVSGDIRLRYAGADLGTISSTADGMSTQTWTGGVDQTKTFGSATNSWGATLTPSIVNDPSFGARVRFFNGSTVQTISVDKIHLILYYTDAAGNNHHQFFWAELG